MVWLPVNNPPSHRVAGERAAHSAETQGVRRIYAAREGTRGQTGGATAGDGKMKFPSFGAVSQNTTFVP